MHAPTFTTTSSPMDSSRPPQILFSPGPHDTRILLCACGNQEVIRGEATWQRFRPDFAQRHCRCLGCETASPLTYNDDSRLYFRRP